MPLYYYVVFFQKKCRTQYCSSSEFGAGCRCVEPFRQLAGIPVVFMFKVTPRQEKDNSASLTSGQLRKLHTALKRAFEATAPNTTAEIATTLQLENATYLTYLSVVVAYSNPGMDTKIAMKPFLRYLDTDDILEFSLGRLNISAALTTNASL